MARFNSRKSLPHDIPDWVPSGALFFVTIVAGDRTSANLTATDSATVLLEAVARYHHDLRWYARIFIVMPDHVHGLFSIPPAENVRKLMQDWKRFTARRTGIKWQRDFFDHRLRSDEKLESVVAYIRENPVRRGLVVRPEDWPWVWEANACEGSAYG